MSAHDLPAWMQRVLASVRNWRVFFGQLTVLALGPIAALVVFLNFAAGGQMSAMLPDGWPVMLNICTAWLALSAAGVSVDAFVRQRGGEVVPIAPPAPPPS